MATVYWVNTWYMNVVKAEIAASTERNTREKSTLQLAPVKRMILNGELQSQRNFFGCRLKIDLIFYFADLFSCWNLFFADRSLTPKCTTLSYLLMMTLYHSLYLPSNANDVISWEIPTRILFLLTIYWRTNAEVTSSLATFYFSIMEHK